MKSIILLFILVISFSLNAQQLSSTQQLFIKSFVKDMYIDTIPYKEIGEKYISGYSSTNKKMDSTLNTLVHIERGFKADMYRSNYNENVITIESYKKLRNKIELPNFGSSGTDSIIVVLLNGKPSSYLYMRNNKILAFTYMQKGKGKDEPAYFLH